MSQVGDPIKLYVQVVLNREIKLVSWYWDCFNNLLQAVLIQYITVCCGLLTNEIILMLL